MPLPLQRVYRTNVPTYADSGLSQRLEGSGVILQMRGDSKDEIALHIYPTTKNWYVEGMDVTWEWNTDKVWPECWFRDLITGVSTLGWSASMEFIGRNLDEV